MIKKSLNAHYGIKVNQNFSSKPFSEKRVSTVDKQERVDICLTCTKPASQCKGTCFGRY